MIYIYVYTAIFILFLVTKTLNMSDEIWILAWLDQYSPRKKFKTYIGHLYQYFKITCGWCIGSLRRTFIVSMINVAGLSQVQKEQNFFHSMASKNSSNMINLLERYNVWQAEVL